MSRVDTFNYRQFSRQPEPSKAIAQLPAISHQPLTAFQSKLEWGILQTELRLSTT
jgi:hypothetical protein